MKLKYLVLTVSIFCLLSILKAEKINRTFTINSDELNLQMDIDYAKVRVIPNESNNDFTIRIKYDRNVCDAEVVYEQSNKRIRIWVDRRNFFKSDDDDQYNDRNSVVIDLELPSQPQLSIKTKIKAGSIDFRLGGLKIKDFALKNWAGEIDIDFDQPNQMTMETMDVSCKLGEVNISNLGNAHCSSIDINSGIGELTVDFCGMYCDGTFAEIDLDIGETNIILPQETAIKMRISEFGLFSSIDYPDKFRRQGKYLYSDTYQQDAKTLDLRISTGIGALNFRMN
jgi:hypothetical protein